MTEDTFGQRVKKARDYRMLTQEELGERAGLSRVHVAAIEGSRADKQPYARTIRRLADALGVRPHWLRDGTGSMLDG
jgi:transcriptional regulator with XRE-family HTH domain